ncbi:unnamed protein product [Arabidopsis lyrata]|nr:unnamed protein product [Arabidopsis lyrata]
MRFRFASASGARNVASQTIPCFVGSNAEQSIVWSVSGESMSQFGKLGAVLMVYRLCHKKGDHWTSRC